MESKIMMMWLIFTLFSILFGISHEPDGISMTKNRNAALNGTILLYNENYIYYYNPMNKYQNNKNVRDVQQYLNRGKCK